MDIDEIVSMIKDPKGYFNYKSIRKDMDEAREKKRLAKKAKEEKLKNAKACKCMGKRIQCPNCKALFEEKNEINYVAQSTRGVWYQPYIDKEGNLDMEYVDEGDGSEDDGEYQCTHCGNGLDEAFVEEVIRYFQDIED